MTPQKKNKLSNFLVDLDDEDILAIYDEYSDGVLVTNASGIIVYYNQAMSRIDDLQPNDAISNKITEVYDLDDSTSIVMRCLNSKKPIINQHIYYRTRMGKFSNTIHDAIPIFNKNKIVGAICFVRDYHTLVNTVASIPIPGIDDQYDRASITFDKIIGKNVTFTDAINTAKMAASTPSPVMLFGKTGTGKELFARAICNHSSRGSNVFTPINCAAIPENLLECILFGTSKGAFTGSVEKEGLFEKTNKGTIFLDELNSMPIGIQGKILRSIQEKKVRRVGALKETKIDIKFISSVNRDPHVAIADGTLRSDLFYRLGVVFIHIVPLQERLDDLHLLVSHFIQKHNILMCKNVKRISPEVIDLFHDYSWPGNVRELEHVIEGAMNIVGKDDTIKVKHIQHRFAFFSAATQINHENSVELGSDPQENEANLKERKNDHEKNIIEKALQDNLGNITKTADMLGISRQLLYYKIKKLGIARVT